MVSKVYDIKNRMSRGINWNNEKLSLWKQFAEEKQLFYCSTLGDRTWEEYQENEEKLLKLKIGFSLFGPQSYNNNDELNKYFSDPFNEKEFDTLCDELSKGYIDPDKAKEINKLFSLIKNESESGSLCVAFIFVIAWLDEKYTEFPVIRIMKKTQNAECGTYFLDMMGRLYKSWPQFLKDNLFPKCIYCYPKDGFYSWDESGKVLLEFGRSPSCKITKIIFRGLDKISTVAGFGGTAVTCASLAIPVAGPVIAGATATALASSAWLTCRTVTNIVDRKQHSQSISVVDKEGRDCWLSLASGILGTASVGAVKYTEFLARSGQVLSRASSDIINSIEIGNTTLLGLSIISNIASAIERRKVDVANVMELIQCVLFFYHSVINFKTAREIFAEIQEGIVNTNEANLQTDVRVLFDKILEETRKMEGDKKGNAYTIRSLKNIESIESFFSNLLNIHNKAQDTCPTLPFNKQGHKRINEKIDINLSEFDRLSDKSKNILFTSSKTLKNNLQHLNNFIEDLKLISKREIINFTQEESEICRILNTNNLKEFEINGKRIFASAKPADTRILSETFNIIKNGNRGVRPILTEVEHMADSFKCNNILEFYSLLLNALKKYEDYKEIYSELKQLYTEIQLHFNDPDPGFTVPLCEEDKM